LERGGRYNRGVRKGIFITFEGPEGSGKSTHLKLLASYLRRNGRRVTLTREPGGTPLAKTLRHLLLQTSRKITPLAELFLYEADRAHHVETCVQPALKRGEIVLCDRYTDSTLAYQGDGRGLPKHSVEALNRIASRAVDPQLTLLLDVPVEQGLRQAHAKKGRHDRLEHAGLAFHRRVRKGFMTLAKRFPRRIRVVSQEKKIETTQQKIRSIVDEYLS
jgi:dTMP kinase